MSDKERPQRLQILRRLDRFSHRLHQVRQRVELATDQADHEVVVVRVDAVTGEADVADDILGDEIAVLVLEDRVVPPSQAERMVEALRAKDLPFAYLAFEGEQHGFRKAETIQRTLEAELYFYSRVFRFPLAEDIEPVEIENLPVLLPRGDPSRPGR